MKRFYKDVAVDRAPEGWRILLDDKPVQTPGRQTLYLPTAALGEAVAAEWRGQGEEIDPGAMPMLRLANTARDGVANTREAVIAAILRLGEHDLLCYRADAPRTLAERQARAWDPLLDWAAESLGARLVAAVGIGHVDQAPEALAALRAAIAAHDDFALAGLHLLASVTGSPVLALGVTRGALTPAQAFALSRLDEDFQAERWGPDAEAAARAAALARETETAAAFIAASRRSEPEKRC